MNEILVINYSEIRDELIKKLINNKLNIKTDTSKNWACYFLSPSKSTKFIIKIKNEIFPISIDIIHLINEVKLGNLIYKDCIFYKK